MKCTCRMPAVVRALTPQKEELECLLRKRHRGRHLVRLESGAHENRYVLWQFKPGSGGEEIVWEFTAPTYAKRRLSKKLMG